MTLLDFTILNQDILILFIAICNKTFNRIDMISLWYLQNRDSYESCTRKQDKFIEKHSLCHPLPILRDMNHLSALISDPSQNCPLDDSIYIHLAAERLWHPYRAARNGIVVRRVLSQLDPRFMSRDNRKYDEETRAQSAEKDMRRLLWEPFNQRAPLIRETRRDKSRRKKKTI